MTNDLHRSCNETASELAEVIRVASNNKYIMGYGSSVIARLLQTSIKNNLFYTIKDKIVEERIEGSAIHRRTQKTKVYGSDSSKSERESLIEILRDRVEYHKDKIISPTIYEELCGMEVKKNGKVEHSSNTHDDQVFSWLWALYVYYHGSDLMNNWGITKRVLRTDADLEEAVTTIQEDKSNTVEAIDLPVENEEEIEEQLKTIKSAAGQKLYEQWMQEEHAKDEAAMQRILSDAGVRKSLGERYGMLMGQAESQVVTTIPTEVFLDFNTDPQLANIEKDSVLAGNLSQYW